MVDSPSADSQAPEPGERRSVLAELPRTRPQRATRRREAARATARAARTGTETVDKEPAAAKAAPKTTPKPAQKMTPKPAQKATPKPAQKMTPKPAQKATPKSTHKTTPKPAQKAAPKPARKAAPKPARKAAPKPRTKAGRRTSDVRPPTPTQGYEADHDLLGTPVTPPTGTEVVGALAELAGELAQNGISAGGRLLKGALSRLSGS